MSIEGSSAVVHHKPATNNTSRLGKGKGAADGELDAPDGAGAGFLALLNSFDSDAVEDDALAPQTAMDQPAPALQPLADPMLKLLPQDQLNDLQLLLAQANEVTGGKFSPLQATAFSGGGADTAVPMDLSLIQPGQGAQVRPLKNRAVEGLSGVGNAMADSRMQSTLASVDVANREVAMTGALVSSGFAEGLARPGDRNSGKSSFLLAGSGAEGIWGQPAFQAAPALDMLGVAAESSASSLESVVADTVSYWVTQGVKNAALKLDGFGEHPLEVNISMQGGETHIDFRTDQPEIRQILEGAMPHLKDLLKSEGVMLSGVSVGASGQNGGGGQDPRDRPGAREGTVVTIKSAPTDSPRLVSLPAGRVLDLFV